LEGIAVLIRSQPDMKLVGTADNAGAAIALYRKRLPDVTVIDLELPDATALAAIREIFSVTPGARLIGLATRELDRCGQEAMAAGVMAVVAKDHLDETLVSLIRHRARPGV
jgi:DNA-binding NarL/FixJ family response regulator